MTNTLKHIGKELGDWTLGILFGAIGILAYLLHWWLLASAWNWIFG